MIQVLNNSTYINTKVVFMLDYKVELGTEFLCIILRDMNGYPNNKGTNKF